MSKREAAALIERFEAKTGLHVADISETGATVAIPTQKGEKVTRWTWSEMADAI